MNSIRKSLKLTIGMILITSLVGLAPLAALGAPDMKAQPPQKESIAKNNLEPFVGAFKEVSKIHNTYEQRIIQSSNQAQTEALQQEANKKMNQAVADHGLTVEDYNTILKAIKNDPVLKEEFLMALNRTP